MDDEEQAKDDDEEEEAGGAGEEGWKVVGWRSLTDDLLELLFARIPLTALVRASAACKVWHSIITSPFFLNLHARLPQRHPWFFLYGVNHLLPARNQGYAFNPDSGKWLILPPSPSPLMNMASLAGADGLLYGMAGLMQCKLFYKLNLMQTEWLETPAMTNPRESPIVGVIKDCSSDAHKLIVAGGIEESEDEGDEMNDVDLLSVEMYDSVSNTWEICPSLPAQLQGCTTRHWMTSAICNSKFYVFDLYEGSISALDLNRKIWSPVKYLRPATTMNYSYLVSCHDQLYLVGLASSEPLGMLCLKVWKIDQLTLEYKELGLMPNSLLFGFDSEEGGKDASFRCVGSGEYIYIFGLGRREEHVIVLCNITSGRVVWHELPCLSTNGHRFDNVVGFCSSLDLRAFL
ncbi:hypothetical protein O6H91_Y226300 [Diphasiastrum complanatum]|nr:hypothetical protein O6H91_Y226300 [Diphasiastrum complanatum]KAJ7294884.1 hypothetical protein O6H91_Y226300 [Diphasiastrum complanatum]